MKNILLGALLVLVVLGIILFIFLKRVSLGGGYVIGDYSHDKCTGFYMETYNDTAVDGGRGGWCFGRVEKVLVKVG